MRLGRVRTCTILCRHDLRKVVRSHRGCCRASGHSRTAAGLQLGGIKVYRRRLNDDQYCYPIFLTYMELFVIMYLYLETILKIMYAYIFWPMIQQRS